MNKTKKKIVIAIAIIVAIIGIGSFSYIQYQNQKQLAVDFLVEKYDFNKTDIEILDFEIEHYYIGKQDIFFDWFYIGKANNKWSIKYKEKQFFVNDIGGKLYDDYQLEDVENWCIEWFRKNIDDRIIGIKIETLYLVEYQIYHANKGNMYIFEREDILDFIISNSIGGNSFYEFNEGDIERKAHIYFDASNLNENEINNVENGIDEIIKKKLKKFKYWKPDPTFEIPKVQNFISGKNYWTRIVDCYDW